MTACTEREVKEVSETTKIIKAGGIIGSRETLKAIQDFLGDQVKQGGETTKRRGKEEQRHRETEKRGQKNEVEIRGMDVVIKLCKQGASSSINKSKGVGKIMQRCGW
mmetsp:Transcript_51588/g.154877  ORF Transcript_51588/g.154877 Transcript_51588/m.154877 type:complete len:107 (-) Transcript_51588:264-584(-)